jgi:8-oxo-dGTP pyrophosphatase MutT (NUDIX family)
MPNTNLNQTPSENPSLSPSIVAEITVSTASAIVTHPDDPYKVLVAKSSKHPHPVIPGGKIEVNDPIGPDSDPGRECVMREVEEEVGTKLLNARYIGKAFDPERDVRVVAPKKVASALTDPPFHTIDLQGVADDQPCIRARYGTPDFIYVGTIDPAALMDTEELSGSEFIDIRHLQPGELSAGHDVIVLKYRDMLDSRADKLDEQALTNFEASRNRLIG